MMNSMHTLVATDIFGLTRHVTDFAKKIGSLRIVDPYRGVRHAFKEEAKAYAYFEDHMGLGAYAAHLTDTLSAINDNCLVVGFSVGAAAGWKAAGSYGGKNLRGVIGFYGSQIRHHTDITPVCPTTLIFPKSEDHFDVQTLASHLEGKDGLECIRTDYLHGFMNPLSRNFDETGYSKYLTWLAERIERFAHPA